MTREWCLSKTSVHAEQTVRLGPDGLQVKLVLRSPKSAKVRIAWRCDWSYPAAGSSDRYCRGEGGGQFALDQVHCFTGHRYTLVGAHGRYRLQSSRVMRVQMTPLRTISRTEECATTSQQGTVILHGFDLHLRPRTEVDVELTFQTEGKDTQICAD